jgi:hypothetical protein
LRTGEFIGSKTAGFPFVLAAKDDQTIYSPECVPEGFSLSDPDHLLASNIIALYRHWLGRQKKGLAPFIVLNPSPLHGLMIKKSEKAKGKKKADYLDVSDDPVDKGDDEEDEEEEEDDDEDEDEDEPPAPSLKFGPPNTKMKPVKTKKTQSEDFTEVTEKKRKTEDELDGDLTTKRQKRGPVRKRGRAMTKTKGDEIKKVSCIIDDLK